MMNSPLHTIAASLMLLLMISAAKADIPPKKITLSDFPAAAVDEVVVPVPSEIFAVLDKLGNPNWKAQLREGDLKQLSQKLNIKYGVIRIFFTDSEVEGRARWITYFAYKKAEEILNAVENEIKSWNRN